MPYGWIKSKKGGYYKRYKHATLSIFQSKFKKDKWKISIHNSLLGLCFHPGEFESTDHALDFLERHYPQVNDEEEEHENVSKEVRGE